MTLTAARLLAVLFAILVIASAPVAAVDSRAGGTVVIAEGETVADDLEAVGGTVIVRGTVDGSVNAVGGTVVIAPTGVVRGDLTGAAGAVTVEGRVEGETQVAAGSFVLREGGVLVGDAEVGAGEALIDGTAEGTLSLDAGTVVVGAGATVGGDLLYDADQFTNEGASVAGDVRATQFDFGGVAVEDVQLFAIPSWLSVAYTVLAHLALGGLLLALLPRFVAEVGDVGLTRTARSGGFGLAALVVGPVLLVLVAVTIVGIPLALLGAVVYGVLLWVGLVFGAYLLGTWGVRALDRTDAEYARWYALLGGVLLVGLSRFVPGGGLFRLALTVIGAGAVLLALNARRTGERGEEPVEPEVGSSGDPAA
ncbi:bactofilin family protein [Halobaculum litoreum]|uniref:bactofilin family protein n=1 Tax=Halobaculum litoreum TaxID=3031998 RepID=UPI0024C33463|nr:polymer-forming cytoskeletal protein [Halobaculum sp. DT92]